MKNKFSILIFVFFSAFIFNNAKAQCPISIDNQLGSCYARVVIQFFSSPSVSCGTPITTVIPPGGSYAITCSCGTGLMRVNMTGVGDPSAGIPFWVGNSVGAINFNPPFIAATTAIPTLCAPGGSATLQFDSANNIFIIN